MSKGNTTEGLAEALAIIANLGVNAISTPRGRFILVGKVPVTLSYMNLDGSALTDEQIDTIRRCGPGFCFPKVRTVSFETKDEALAAAAEVLA